MKTVSTAYGDWLSNYDWTHFFTIRKHHVLSELQVFNMAKRLLSCPHQVQRLFYSIERDRQLHTNHVHFIIESHNTDLSLADVAVSAGLGRNPKTIGAFENVTSTRGVSYYTSKYVGGSSISHDYLERGMLL